MSFYTENHCKYCKYFFNNEIKKAYLEALTSPENQNKMLEPMAYHALRKILENIHSSPFIAVMVDESTDKSNKEQLTLVWRWISENFVVSEEFVGLYYLSAIDAQSIVEVMKDAFIRFQIPLTKIRGQ